MTNMVAPESAGFGPGGTVQQAVRVDRAQMPSVSKTPEGYLRGEAIVTRTGVFRYVNGDGSERLELRHPDDVLASDTLDTLRGLPITIDHPPTLVNADNARDLSVGLTGDAARVDGQNILTTLTVTHADGVQAVGSGRRELSLGYTLDLEEESGEYNGQPYTHRQKNVRYNHLALVQRGRAGASARINLDGYETAVLVSDETQPEEVTMTDKTLATVNLDGLEYQAAPEVAKAYTKAVERADAAEAERADAKKSYDEMKKEYDSLQGKMDALKEEMDKMKSERGDEAVAEAAKARVSLLTKAAKAVNTDELLDASEREVMEAVVKSRNDTLDLSDKSDDYVQARFDSVLESLPTDEGIKAQAEKAGARADAAEPEKDHRADAIASITNMWKKEA